MPNENGVDTSPGFNGQDRAAIRALVDSHNAMIDKFNIMVDMLERFAGMAQQFQHLMPTAAPAPKYKVGR